MPKPYVYRRADELGIPVTDAKESIKVVVTATDVIKAKQANSKHCALARATMRLPDVNAAYFFRSKAFLEFDDRIEKYDLPVSVQKEIVSFDRAHVFAPGVYQIRPASPANNVKGLKKRLKKDRQRRKVKKALQEAKAAEARIAKVKESGEPITKKVRAEMAPDVAAVQLGKRVLSGIKKAGAPEPLWSERPTKYQHRTQYVRDMAEPE